MRYFKLLLNIFIPLFHNLLFLLNQIGGFEGTHCSCSSVLFRVLILSRWLQRYLSNLVLSEFKYFSIGRLDFINFKFDVANILLQNRTD